MKTILICFGTRPEAIKLAPIIQLLEKKSQHKVILCATGQHKMMLDQVLSLFSIRPAVELSLSKRKQTLDRLSQRLLDAMPAVFDKIKPDVVLVQGDTTTAAMVALSSYYQMIPVAHIEAGLRTHDKWMPFPEEVNRHIISSVADLHFAPTKSAARNLIAERVPKKSIYIVGNTIVDALDLLKSKIDTYEPQFNGKLFKKLILLTVHRRESLGKPIADIFGAIKSLAKAHPDVQFVYPVHLNPRVWEIAHTMLKAHENILLLPPVSYLDLLYLLKRCVLVMTDSGGIQEEAPSFGKFVVVLREKTERNEGISEGMAVCVGTNQKKIIETTDTLLKKDRTKHLAKKNPYGDGKTAQKIVRILNEYLDS